MMSSAGYLGIDPRLPQLPVAFDLAAVSRLYRERWSGPAEPRLEVVVRKVHDVKYQPSARCLVAHELTLRRGGDEPVDTIGVVDVRPAGLGLRAFHEDPGLPWLAEAVDPEKMGRHLRALRLVPGSRILRIVPVRYKAGSRCVLRFDLEAGSLYAKILADGDRPWRTLIAHRGRDLPRLLQPLEYSTELHMFLLPAVTGGELHVRAFDPTVAIRTRLEWMRRAGVLLASLHAARVPAGAPRRIADDAEELGGFSALIAGAAPSLALPFDEAIGRLRSAASREPSAVTSHGAFRTDQLLLDGDEPLMIDLDKLCRANPARDVGNFLAYLRWKAIREPRHASFIEAAVSSFLDGYGSVRTAPDERWTARYEAGSMLKIAGRRFRNLDVGEWVLVPRLLDEARALLERGERTPASRAAGARASLRAALDVEVMTAALRPFGGGPVVSRADLIWERPDDRWTIRYALGESGTELVGKMYRDTARGRWVHEVMRRLWEYAASGVPQLGVPRPLGWIPELSMLVYVPVSGRVLGDTLFDERAPAYVDLAAAWLSALHRSRLALDRAFEVGTELTNLHAWSSIVGERYPDQAPAADRITGRLSERASELGAETGRPIHKDFHHQHVFVADGVGVIDFDEVRLGDPNFDLAHFCGYLTLLGCRIPAMVATLDRLRDEFLTSYRRHTGWKMDGRFAAFYAYTCLKIAKQLCTAGGLPPRPHAEEEHRQTAAILAQGVAALDRG